MPKTHHQTFPRKIPQGYASQVGPMLSVACFQSRHQDCTGDCRPMLPFACGCTCHQTKPLTS
jgi:hypothetical protein